MVAGDVALLAGIALDVVELFAVDQPPTWGHHSALAPLLGPLDPLRVDRQNALGPIRPAAQQRRYACAVDIEILWDGCAGELGQGREDVDVRRERVNIARLAQRAVGPANEERHAMAAVIFGALLAAHTVVDAAPGNVRVGSAVVVDARGRAIVGGEDEDGVVA